MCATLLVFRRASANLQHLCVNLFHLMDALDLEGVPDLEVSPGPQGRDQSSRSGWRGGCRWGGRGGLVDLGGLWKRGLKARFSSCMVYQVEKAAWRHMVYQAINMVWNKSSGLSMAAKHRRTSTLLFGPLTKTIATP